MEIQNPHSHRAHWCGAGQMCTSAWWQNVPFIGIITSLINPLRGRVLLPCVYRGKATSPHWHYTLVILFCKERQWNQPHCHWAHAAEMLEESVQPCSSLPSSCTSCSSPGKQDLEEHVPISYWKHNAPFEGSLLSSDSCGGEVLAAENPEHKWGLEMLQPWVPLVWNVWGIHPVPQHKEG